MTFVNDLAFGQVSEMVILDKLKKHFKPKQIKDKTCDIEFPVKIEIKRERAVNRYGNVAIELQYKNKPSGINATEADIWIWAIDESYWWSYSTALKKWLKNNKDKYIIKTGGDGNNSTLAIIKAITFCNEVANKFSL